MPSHHYNWFRQLRISRCQSQIIAKENHYMIRRDSCWSNMYILLEPIQDCHQRIERIHHKHFEGHVFLTDWRYTPLPLQQKPRFDLPRVFEQSILCCDKKYHYQVLPILPSVQVKDKDYAGSREYIYSRNLISTAFRFPGQELAECSKKIHQKD